VVAEESDEHQRLIEEYLARAAFCKFSASREADKQYREFLETLVVEWEKAATLAEQAIKRD
jgi:hypothetical protein